MTTLLSALALATLVTASAFLAAARAARHGAPGDAAGRNASGNNQGYPRSKSATGPLNANEMRRADPAKNVKQVPS